MLTRLRAMGRGWSGSGTDVDDEDGSTLVLYPFAVLVVVLLGGLALDVALFFQAHRDAVDTAAGLASDIAGVVDEAAFASSSNGSVVIDADRARTLLELTNRDLADHPHGLRCSAAVRAAEPATVDVLCTGTADAILLPAGGLLGRFDLRGAATASAVER